MRKSLACLALAFPIYVTVHAEEQTEKDGPVLVALQLWLLAFFDGKLLKFLMKNS